MTENEFHLKEAKSCNNKTWSILDKTEDSEQDRDEAIRLVNTSYHHWRIVGEPVNFQRAEYMLAKVYNKFGLKELALHHARNCEQLTKEHNFKDFDLAFSYEILYESIKVMVKRKRAKHTLKRLNKQEMRLPIKRIEKFSLMN